MKKQTPTYRATELVARSLEEQGRRRDWLATQAGITGGHVTRVLKNERGVTEAVGRKIAAALGLPFSMAFILPNRSELLLESSVAEERAA